MGAAGRDVPEPNPRDRALRSEQQRGVLAPLLDHPSTAFLVLADAATAAAIPGADFVPIAGAGHLTPMERPGAVAAALAELEDLKKRSLRGSATPFNLALVYLGLGDRARALDYLEKAYAADSQWLGWLKNDRVFDPLRSEPRFMALMKKLHFAA